jgi:hypothetical protein
VFLRHCCLLELFSPSAPLGSEAATLLLVEFVTTVLLDVLHKWPIVTILLAVIQSDD